MKLSSGFSIILIFISVALSGCDHGYNTSAFSGTAPVFDCSATATNGGLTSCVPAGSGTGDSTPVNTTAVITADNYQFLANQISAQLDHLIRHRPGNPPNLAELGLLLLKKIQDDTVTVCTNDPTSLTVSTSSTSTSGTSYRLDFNACLIEGKAANGSLNVSNFTANGDLGNDFASWDTQASIDIGSFSYTLSSDLSINFVGSVDINAINDLSTIDTSLTLTNFNISENNTGDSNTDTFSTAVLSSSDDSNNQSINVSATLNNTSVTQGVLNITSSASLPLTWDKVSGSDNPITGSLTVADNNNASTLTLSANDLATMTVSFNSGSASTCATWGNLNPAACGP